MVKINVFNNKSFASNETNVSLENIRYKVTIYNFFYLQKHMPVNKNSYIILSII